MRIFLSYRRGPITNDITGRIEDQLRRHFGEHAVFRDSDIPLGEDFHDYLTTSVAASDVLLAIIGRDWVSAGNLQSEDDFVRIEIATALKRNIMVVPILVGGARLARKANLPVSLHPLLRKQALVLDSGVHFNTQIKALIHDIERRSNRPTSVTPPLAPAEPSSTAGSPPSSEVGSSEAPAVLSEQARGPSIKGRFRVLLVDDQEYAFVLAAALEGSPYDVLVARSAAEALEIVEREDIQVVVSDEWMPGVRGVELLTQLARHHPYIVRILMTAAPELDFAVRAINDGRIFRFLTMPCSSVTLDCVIRDALIQQSHGKLKEDLMRITGQGMVALHRIEGLSAGAAPDATLGASIFEAPLDQLSRREQKIVEVLLKEGTVTEVAKALKISIHTVRHDLESIFRKVGARSQVELFAKFRQ